MRESCLLHSLQNLGQLGSVQQFIVGCAAVQVPYCAQLRADPDTALNCRQQQQAQDSCRRTCGLCYDKVDSSSLVWYNQAKSLGSTLALTPPPTPTLTPTLASSQNAPQVEDDVADAISTQQIESGADSMLMQPATAGTVAKGKKANLSPSIMHESQVDVTVGPMPIENFTNTVEQLRNSSGESDLIRATAFSAVPESHPQDRIHMHLVGSQDSWKNHLSNPFCKSVLCLCVLLLTCIICLLKGKFKRRKVLR